VAPEPRCHHSSRRRTPSCVVRPLRGVRIVLLHSRALGTGVLPEVVRGGDYCRGPATRLLVYERFLQNTNVSLNVVAVVLMSPRDSRGARPRRLH
jgi:hypothetical protein